MNQTKNEPQVTIVKRVRSISRPVIYILITNLYSENNEIVYKIFPQFDLSKSSKAIKIN